MPVTGLPAATVADYHDHLVISGHSPRTIHGYLKYLARLDAEVGATTTDSRALVRWLARPGWSNATRKSARTAVRAWYRWATAEGIIDSDPSSRLPHIHVPRTVPRPAPDDVWAQAWAQAHTWQERMLLLLACHAGLRRAELAAVARDSFVDGDTAIRVTGKGGRTRVVPLSSDLQQHLTDWPADQHYLCPGRFGGHVEPSYVGKRLSRLLGPGWSGHTLRHRAATLTYEASGDLAAAQELLGHASPETTRIYTHVSGKHLRSAVAAGAAMSPIAS